VTYPPELRQRAKELRKHGLLIRVIAAELGVPKPTVTRWLNPKLEARGRTRARRLKYAKKRRCPACGGKRADTASLCKSCSRAGQRYWTRERIVEALRTWAAEHGRVPVHEDWERSGKGHPAISSILAGPNPPFASWSEMLLAAGFTPRKKRGPKWTTEKLNRKERAALRRANREDVLKRAIAKENTDEQPQGRP
jgi:hypothetical protein